MKSNYTTPETSIYDTELRMSFLTGSVTNKAMTINRVEVHDFDNGFDEGGNDFKDISFD